MNSSDWYSQDLSQAKILLVDDNQLNIKVLYELFRADYDVYIALNGEQALARCAELQPDLVLLDIVMPRMDGFEVCRQLKANPELAAIPVIFVTGYFDEAEEARGFAMGAVDFIHKPVNPVITKARVRTQLQLKRQTDLLKAISQLDGLTGIANRRRFDLQLELDWRRCARANEPLSLLLLDIDYFKQYNDELGHLAGDECLRQMARSLSSCLGRPYDLLARYGGEEFVVLLPQTNLAGAEFLAQQMVQRVRDLALHHPAVAGGIVSVSIGVASQIPQESLAPLTLVRAADEQLYRAKQAGRDRICSPLNAD